jgi:cobaltochelatase CobT
MSFRKGSRAVAVAASEPIAFLSYVRAGDDHDHGRITKLRARLEGEVRMHTGKTFKIYQDKKDLKWGEQWKKRLDATLLNVTFLIPIVTPSYFQSKPCRDEFEQFLVREKQLGENHLILPIYYLESDEISDIDNEDSIGKILKSRN